MLKIITAKEARNRLGEYLDRAHLSSEAFLITRKERGKAVLLSATQYLQLLDRLEAFETGNKTPPAPQKAAAVGNQVLTKEQLRTFIE